MSTVGNTAIFCLGIYLIPFSFLGLFVFTFVNYVSGYVCGYLSASSLVFLVHHCGYFCFIAGIFFFFQFLKVSFVHFGSVGIFTNFYVIDSIGFDLCFYDLSYYYCRGITSTSTFILLSPFIIYVAAGSAFVSQCENFMIFLSLRFYVKSISSISRCEKSAIFTHLEALNCDFL